MQILRLHHSLAIKRSVLVAFIVACIGTSAQALPLSYTFTEDTPTSATAVLKGDFLTTLNALSEVEFFLDATYDTPKCDGQQGHCWTSDISFKKSSSDLWDIFLISGTHTTNPHGDGEKRTSFPMSIGGSSTNAYTAPETIGIENFDFDSFGSARKEHPRTNIIDPRHLDTMMSELKDLNVDDSPPGNRVVGVLGDGVAFAKGEIFLEVKFKHLGTATTIPEPSSLIMIVIGLSVFGYNRTSPCS